MIVPAMGSKSSIELYIDEYDLHSKFKLRKNSIRRWKMANLYYAIHQCDDNDIIIILDGDDWLFDENVFNYFNCSTNVKISDDGRRICRISIW